MKRERRFAAGGWSLRSTLVPNWAFWSVICATAVVLGLAIAYVGSPDSAAPIEVGAASATGDEPAEGDAASTDSGEWTNDDSATAVIGTDPLAQFDGVEVQVLNATSTDDAAEEMAARLEGEGFRIADVEVASRVYQRTTVFWTRGAGRALGEALASHFGWRAAPKPDNLTDEISVHVVVGEDEA